MYIDTCRARTGGFADILHCDDAVLDAQLVLEGELADEDEGLLDEGFGLDEEAPVEELGVDVLRQHELAYPLEVVCAAGEHERMRIARHEHVVQRENQREHCQLQLA